MAAGVAVAAGVVAGEAKVGKRLWYRRPQGSFRTAAVGVDAG